MSPIAPDERGRMLCVPLCGPGVLMRLEAIGVTRLEQLAGRDPRDLLAEVDREAGRIIWRPPIALEALANLVDVAEGRPPGWASSEPTP